MERTCQILLSLPPVASGQFGSLGVRVPPDTFVVHDPPGVKLGSGGGFANALVVGWRASGEPSWCDWLRRRPRVVIHSGGESRRCPAYAAEGKVLTPMPVLRWSYGQRFDQVLLDLQLGAVNEAMRRAPEEVVAAVYSGDVVLRGRLPAELPDADVVCVGLWESPEAATRHGVFFCDRGEPERLLFMRQKPTPAEIRTLAREALFLVDSGFWLFTERALESLLAACGWNGADFADGRPAFYDLYGDFGRRLGRQPGMPGGLTAAVATLDDGEFYHLGTSRELVSTTLRLQNANLDQRRFGNASPKHPAAFIQNAQVAVGLHLGNRDIWIENACVAAGWRLHQGHVVTGVPENAWDIELPAGCCLDVVPIGDQDWCIRFYGIDDVFRGVLGDPRTGWLGAAAQDWFRRRGVDPAACGLCSDADIHDAALFPVVSSTGLCAAFVQWLLGRPDSAAAKESALGPLLNQPVADDAGGLGGTGHAAPAPAPDCPSGQDWASFYAGCRRLSASELGIQANLERRAKQRAAFRLPALARMAALPGHPVFARLDLDDAAGILAASGCPPTGVALPRDGLDAVRCRMFRASLRRRLGCDDWQHDETAAFAALREDLIAVGGAEPVMPRRHLLPDQIIWGRAPVRLDLAGGWTDTPPYCLTFGGAVVNVAVELNGQPPIQIFGRCTEAPEIVLRSIDLGRREVVSDYGQLRTYNQVGDAFSIPKAALALAGFLPEFNRGAAATLADTLRDFGGGIELTLLAAVPKGSGLGTSSILAATALGTLGDLCGLAWDEQELIRRTLVLEQLLTTGGGWQDQAGGIVAGLKLLESQPGIRQDIRVRWLPDGILRRGLARTVLLYYTGMTRIAKDILQEVVRGVFLNATGPLGVIGEIGGNAAATADALQRQDWAGLVAGIRRSWDLNRRLDAGTDPEPVRHLLRQVDDYLAAAKLLGAGGGGYLLMVAKDEEAAARLRRRLTENPPNGRARFVDACISDGGLQVTRS